MILVSKSLVPAALLRGARAAALALIALAWLASPGAQAQTGGTRVSDVLVSNTGQSDIAGISVGKYLYAQPFNTGDHGGGYHLAGVVLDFGAAPSAAAGTITVTVREDSSGNPSGNVLYTLINPAFSVGSNEFLAPLNAELNEDRTYWVVASHAGSFLDGPKWLRTPISDGLDAGSVVGWTIDATYKGATRSNPSLWLEGVPNDALQIAVKGSIQDLAAIRPGAPQTFEVKQGDTRMTLSWAEPADAGSLVAAITKYQYRFSAGATVAGGAIWNDVPDSIDLDASTADETQVVVTGLSNGTLYAFEVRAVSSAGNGVAAGPRNATPRHVLATNVGQAPFLGAVEATGHQKANEFTTGSNANGYTLQSIELDFDELPTNHAEATALTVSLWSATAAGEPNAALATLINPVNLLVADGSSVNATGETGVKGVKAFRAPANTGLSADTKYFVHVVCSQCFNVYINTTESTAVDAGHDANWSISVPLFSYYANRSPPVWSNTFHDRRLKIGINGTTGGGGAATTNAPTAADNTVTIAQSARHTFTVGQFGFADADAGATLASVRIVGLPAAGTLALRGTKVVVGQIVPRADIVGGFLIFRPVPGAPGDPYATFTFKVNDGIVDSANANTMTINVPVPAGATAPDAPTGLTATADGQSEIDLNWDAPADDGRTNITGYRIEVSPDGASASWADLVAHTTPDRNVIRTSYSHKGLDAATTRHYRVSAINAVGTSDPSNTDHATTEAATRQTEIVAADWALKPTDIAAGEQFRLMFVSSTKQDAFSADIADYNTFVSDLAAAGVTAMQNYAGDFTALVSTETVNARENTLTRDTDTDVPIYWVRSGPVAATNRAADDYADFYDGAWSTRNNGYNESGSFVGLGGGQFWTGTNPDGTTHATGFMSSRTAAIRWRVESSGAILTTTSDLSRPNRIVALSPVFQVAAANNPPTAADNTVTIGADAAYTLKAADFGFADTDTGDTLASVRIETLPGAGELKLDDAAAVVDQVVTRADIDDNKLTFTPVAGASGDNYASFMFKVNDGTDFSAAANTITFNVSVVSCGMPDFGARRDHWSGTVTMGVNGSGGVIFGYGFNEGPGIGSLTDPKGFSIGSNSYTIKSVNVETELGDVGEGALRFYLTSNNLTSAEAAALKLHVCDSAGFDFAGPDVETKDSDYSYSWAAAALDWSPPVATRTLYLSLPANQAATGEPTITGTAQAGQDLTADVSGIDDDDGLPGVLDYQWYRVDADGASDETEIAGEIASTYTLTTADVGKKVKVKVSFTDDLSGDEERTSGAYPTSDTVTAANTAPTGADKTVTMGSDTTHTFTAVDFGFADTDTGDTLVSVIIESVPALGELTLDGTAVTADDVIPNADIDEGKLTFTPAAGASGDAYASFTFKVNDGTDFSAVANTITFNLRDLSCGMPDFAGDNRRDHWSGTVTVGGDDTIGYGFASGTGSLDPNVFSIGSNSYTIDLVTVGADAATRGALSLYLTSSNLTSAEAEALKLHVCDSAGFDFVGNDVDHQDADFSYVWAAAALDWSLPVATRTLYLSLPANNDATGVPTITGTARVGQELTADVSGIDDDDGLPSVFEYRWFRVDSDGSSNETEITGETASTYTLTTADVGKKVKVKVSFTDHLNGEEERTSAAYPASDTVAQMTTMVSIASGGDVAAEGDDATFTLTFSPAAPAGGLTVNVSVAEVRQRTLESGELPYDFVDAANEGMKTVDVAAGETSATLTVPTVDDELYEAEAGADNLLTATLATGTDYAVATGSDSAELTLMDGADRPVLAWKTDKVTVTEGVDDNAEVVLTLSHPLVEEVRFSLVAVDGTALLSSDYTYPDAGEILTFAPGATEATTQAGILDRPLLEGTEIFTVRVFNDAAVSVTLASDSTITVEILDADTMQLSPSAVLARVVEGDAIRIKIDTLPSGSCLFGETFFVTVTPSGDTATLTDANAVEQRFGSCDTTHTVSFATSEDATVTANRTLSFTLATKAGTDARITVTDDNVVEVAVIDDDRHATGAPTITGTAQVNQVLTASPGSIADGDGLAGAAYTYTWIRVDGSDETPITGTTGNSYTLVAADQGNTLKVKASFTDDAGFDEERTSAPTATVIGLNSAPVFSQTAQARSIAENTAAGVDIGAAVTATDAGDTLTYTLGGADMASFDIVAATGQIRTKSGVSYDHEAKSSYTVTVTATDSSNATAVASVTISVTDVAEPPDAPAQPTVTAVTGSATSLAVSWAAPANAGKPDIDDYDVQYRLSGTAAWSDGPQNVTGTTTTATITSLAAGTLYEVQVRATNAEGDSGWSAPPGAGRTNAPTNNVPVFSPSNVSRNIAENTAAGQDIGAAVTATDADADTLSYTLGGVDMASFDFVATTGQIRTKAGVSYDHEAKSSYTVTVTASDSSNATAVASVTISVTDVAEPPDAPATPAVNAVSGSATSLAVSWAAPANAGKPDIDDYDVQYRVSGATAWSDGPQNVNGTSTTITSLAAGTLYEVQVRATNDEGDSGWSAPPGAGRTNAPTNNAPVFSPSNVSRNIAENTAAGEDIGAAVTATDDAGDTITYTLGGADMASFDFVEASGQIRTKAGVSYDHEAKSSYTVTVTASDSSNATAVASVTISVTDVAEPPDAPATPAVNAVSGSATSLAVSWAAPANAGKPDIDDYDVQYRVSGATAWSDGPQNVNGTSTTITSLAAGTLYEVQVRATNAEGDSGWSDPPGAGRTNAPTNNVPVFSPSNVSRNIAENTAAGEDIGAAVTATDDAGDTITYTLGGADMASFDFVEASGQIRTKAGVTYDHEAKSSYTVTVTATDSSNATAEASVTISITDVNEPPDAPATPAVNAVSGSATSLAVSWAAPANAGKPDIDDYDVQYRVSGATAWSDGPQNVTGTSTTATITSLAANTLYEVQVRATNAEGDSGWSDPPGAGRTNAPTNNVPVFSPSNVSRNIAENTAAGQDIGAAVTATDADADTLSYTLGGVDMASFDFVATTGQIRTKAGVSYDHEAKSSYTVTVTASDSSNATAVASVTISVTDVAEPPDAPATPAVNAVSGSTTSLAVSWAAPANAGKPDIDDYDVQYRVSGATAWSDGPQNVNGTSTTITSLAAGTLYEVQVRATNDEGDSGWSAPPGAGRTNAPTNNAPVFSPSNVSRNIAENTAAGEDIGAAVTATDDAGDTITYTLGGADMASFDFVEASGQIRTKAGVSYDHEAKSSYTVTVTASDSSNATAVASVTISVTDVAEPPDAPATPAVNAVSGSATSLAVSWAAPANAGKPDIDDYDVQYRVSGTAAWSDGPQNVTGTTTTATITSLAANTLYEVQVRATNAEGDSGWSDPPGSGRTNAPTNNAPVFSPSNVSRNIAENTAAGQDIGAAVTATDADGDTLSYTLGGADMASFDIVAATGQIRTKAGVSYDHEAKSSYTVTVTATDSSNATAVASVTISITDVDEPPDAPATPAVNAVSGSTTSLAVSWAAPANAGKPDIDDYDVQYRVTGSGADWSDGGLDVNGTSTTITSLAADTPYEVQVRATNAEGDSGWSAPPGSGRTNAPTAAAPGAPENLRTTPGDGQVTLTWAAPASNGGAAISKYQYRAKETDASVWTPDWMDVPDGSDPGSSAADETRVTVSGLTNGTQYRFEVRAVNSIGEGTAASRNETPVAAPARVPGQPRSLFAVSGDGQVTLTWEAPQNDGGAAIVRYDYRHAQGTSVPASEPWLSAGLNLRQTVAGLDNDRQYTFEVRAANSAGESDPASIQATPAANATAPSAPRFLTATAGDRFVLLAWHAPERTGGSSISDYEYRHAIGASVPDATPWRSSDRKLEVGIRPLENGERCTFQVRAVGSVVGPVATVTATPSASPAQRLPGRPRDVTLSAKAYADDRSRKQYAEVTLSWNPPTDLGNSVLERYEYRYAEEDSALADERWRHSQHGRLSITAKRLKLETVYVFELRALTLEGPGRVVQRAVPTPTPARLRIVAFAQGKSATEGEVLTIGVRRPSHLEITDTFVALMVDDSAFPASTPPDYSRESRIRIVSLPSDSTTGTTTVMVPFDGASPSSRTLTVTLTSVQRPYYIGTPATLSISVIDSDAALSVRDARVSEAPGAMLEFAVTLDRTRDREVTVKYATSDGTATAGDDYTHTAGTLVFSAGDTEKTVSVPVLDDVHDEGSETLILTLSNAMGAVITDTSATGTISNSDPLPKGWLARFGRTSATQVLGLLDARS